MGEARALPFDRYEGAGRRFLGRPALGGGSSRRGYGRPVFEQCGFACAYCGYAMDASYEVWLGLSVDHVIPIGPAKRLGYPLEWVEDMANQVTCCRACNEFLNGYRVNDPPPATVDEFFDLRDRHFLRKREWVLPESAQPCGLSPHRSVSSKPVRRGSPTLGRFDSCAALFREASRRPGRRHEPAEPERDQCQTHGKTDDRGSEETPDDHHGRRRPKALAEADRRRAREARLLERQVSEPQRDQRDPSRNADDREAEQQPEGRERDAVREAEGERSAERIRAAPDSVLQTRRERAKGGLA